MFVSYRTRARTLENCPIFGAIPRPLDILSSPTKMPKSLQPSELRWDINVQKQDSLSPSCATIVLESQKKRRMPLYWLFCFGPTWNGRCRLISFARPRRILWLRILGLKPLQTYNSFDAALKRRSTTQRSCPCKSPNGRTSSKVVAFLCQIQHPDWGLRVKSNPLDGIVCRNGPDV
jgi:hypothetical protein